MLTPVDLQQKKFQHGMGLPKKMLIHFLILLF